MPPPPYLPDDARLTPQALEYLHDTPAGIALRQAVAQLPDPSAPTVAQIAALRKSFPQDPLHAALTLAKLQPKATAKFPGLPYVWATPEALEQATHAHVARYKAGLLARHKPRRIYDLCAGIGGDTLALANVAPIIAIDLSPVRTTCLRFNLLEATSFPLHPVDIRTADLYELLDSLPADAWLHIDPARRSAGKRSPHYADLIPGPDVLERLFARVRDRGGMFVKLSPAVDFASLPEGHLQLISHDGSVVQALLAVGTAQPPAQRTATVLITYNDAWSLTASPLPVNVAPLPPAALDEVSQAQLPIHLYEVDGAITRAGLAQHLANAHHLLPLTIDGGYLLSLPGAPLVTLPPLTPFRVHAIVPFSKIPDVLLKLPSAPPGPVEVKARGHLPGIDTDHLQRAWSKLHPLSHTVLLFPHPPHQTLAALATRPLKPLPPTEMAG